MSNNVPTLTRTDLAVHRRDLTTARNQLAFLRQLETMPPGNPFEARTHAQLPALLADAAHRITELEAFLTARTPQLELCGKETTDAQEKEMA